MPLLISPSMRQLGNFNWQPLGRTGNTSIPVRYVMWLLHASRYGLHTRPNHYIFFFFLFYALIFTLFCWLCDSSLRLCYKVKYEFIYAGKREARESFWKHGFSLFVRGSSATVLQSTSGWCDQRKPEDIRKAS